MEFDCVRVEGEALVQQSKGVVVATFVVQLVCLFVILVGAEKGIRHAGALLEVVAI
jgi:hypothetical protein